MNAAREAPAPCLLNLGRQPYLPTWRAMQAFTAARSADTADEFWFLEHPPVFTQGLAGRPEHLLAPGDIAVVQTDRGGQVTYHGPGQLMVYALLDLRRLGIGPRGLVNALEHAVTACLGGYGIDVYARRAEPGVYVDQAKIASVGLRVRRGCSYHGLALNVAMDLAPFGRINPCGYAGLEMTQTSTLGGPGDTATATDALIPHLLQAFGWRTAAGGRLRDDRERLSRIEVG